MTAIYAVCNNNNGARARLRGENARRAPSVHEVLLPWQQTRARHADNCLQKSDSGIFKWSRCRSAAKNPIAVDPITLILSGRGGIHFCSPFLWLLWNFAAESQGPGGLWVPSTSGGAFGCLLSLTPAWPRKPEAPVLTAEPGRPRLGRITRGRNGNKRGESAAAGGALLPAGGLRKRFFIPWAVPEALLGHPEQPGRNRTSSGQKGKKLEFTADSSYSDQICISSLFS